MASDPNIILGIRPPAQESPLATLGGLMQIKEGQARMALQSQQRAQSQAATQNIQAEADALNRDIADQNTLQGLYKDPAFAKSVSAWDGKTAFPLDGKVQPKTADAVRTKVLADQKNALANTDEQTKQNGVKFDHVERTLKSLLYDPTDPSKPAEDSYVTTHAPGAFAQLVRDGDLDPKNVPDVQNPEALRNFAVVTGHHAGLNAYAQANAKTKQEIATSAATAAMDTAHAEQFSADAGKLAQDKLNLQATLPKLEADAKIAQLDAAFKAAHGGLSADQVATTAETQRHNKADEASAAGHLKIARDTYDKTFGPNALNQGLVGVPPHLVAPASAAALKAGEEYAAAAQVSDSMKTMLAMAEKGNKAAGTNLPLVGVETLNAINGIKRINGAEIAQYGSAGSLLDKLQGKLGKITTGQPIPQDVLDDIRALHTELDKGAKQKYADKVQIINQTYNSKFKPAELGGTGGTVPTVSTQAEYDKLPSGATFLEDGQQYRKP